MTTSGSTRELRRLLPTWVIAALLLTLSSAFVFHKPLLFVVGALPLVGALAVVVALAGLLLWPLLRRSGRS